MPTTTPTTATQAAQHTPADKFYSADGMHFTVQDTLLRAMDNMGQLHVGQVIYASSKVTNPGAPSLNADSILLRADTEARNAGGDPFGAGFFSVSMEARDELQALLNTWVEKYVHTESHVTLGPMEEVALTEAMIRDFYARAGLDKLPSPVPFAQGDNSVMH